MKFVCYVVVVCLFSQIQSQVPDICRHYGYTDCTSKCDRNTCRDHTKFIQGLCKHNGGCICQPGFTRSDCSEKCEPGRYGIACLCDTITGCKNIGVPVSRQQTTTLQDITENEHSTVTGMTSSQNGEHRQLTAQYIIIIAISATAFVILCLLVTCLVIRKLKAQKSITRHIERQLNNSETLLVLNGERIDHRVGNEYFSSSNEHEILHSAIHRNTGSNITDDPDNISPVEGYTYIDVIPHNERLDDQNVTNNHYTEISEQDLHTMNGTNQLQRTQTNFGHYLEISEQDLHTMNGANQLQRTQTNFGHYLEISEQDLYTMNGANQLQRAQPNFGHYLEISEQDLASTDEVYISPTYVSPSNVSDVHVFVIPDIAVAVPSHHTAVSNRAYAITTDIRSKVHNPDGVYNILNQNPNNNRYVDNNYDHVTLNDQLYNQLNFTCQ